jgi:hypothetical protein
MQTPQTRMDYFYDFGNIAVCSITAILLYKYSLLFSNDISSEWLVRSIQEDPGSNHNWVTGYSDWGFLFFF